MNFDPGGEVVQVTGFVAELGEVEPRGGGGGVVAGGAVFLNERVRPGEGWGRGRAASGEKNGGDGYARGKNQVQHRVVAAGARCHVISIDEPRETDHDGLSRKRSVAYLER